MTPGRITAPALAFPNIAHAFFTREGGVSTGIYQSLNGGRGSADDKAAVEENRRRMASVLGSDLPLATPYQVHSADAVIATQPWTLEDAPKADAVVTATPGLAIGIGTADCGPILLADPERGVIAAAHAGWKGAFTGIIEATLVRMEELGARRERITAALGPCIRQPSYEVGPEFVDRLVAADAANAAFFIPSRNAGHHMFDLGGFIVSRLGAAGIARTEDLGLDTYTDEERFYSYRRVTHRGEPDYGRLIAAIALMPD
jgi:YfiH family protein